MDKPFSSHINYPKLVDDAMRGIAIKLIKALEYKPLKGDHYFLISFITNFPGAELSERLLQKYPNEMTIVLQHQFEDIKVSEIDFNVKLSFGGIQEKILIPFSSMTAFVDPSTKFALQFTQGSSEKNGYKKILPSSEKIEKKNKNLESKVLVLDNFRKN